MEYKIVDDIDVECDITIGDIENVTIVFLEAENYKKECEVWIDKLKKYWNEATKDLHSQVSDYVQHLYKEDIGKYELLDIYIDLEDKMGTFGLMYRLENDTEHGLGVKFENFKIKKVGPAETSFLGL